MILLLVLFGCGAGECPEGSMLESEEGLVVTEAEHPAAWGDADCAGCHALDALHRRSCVPGVDLAEVRAIVDEGGVESCTGCHGDLGVTP